DTSGMGILLALHLGVVMALFLTLPYGKFAHGFFRCAALLKGAPLAPCSRASRMEQ
ncbi:hypothetical protein ONJ45_27200, partial [Salmonella enterica subsp. enterica serovar Virginia]|nr:hypothetical protein [Salmonella enterica subsp. enterica serovar Virginia]